MPRILRANRDSDASPTGLTPLATKALMIAGAVAESRASSKVSITDLMVGILSQESSLASRLVLAAHPWVLPVDLCDSPTTSPFDEKTLHVIDIAHEEAAEMACGQVNTGHLLLAVLDTDASARALLNDRGVRADATRLQLRALVPEDGEVETSSDGPEVVTRSVRAGCVVTAENRPTGGRTPA